MTWIQCRCRNWLGFCAGVEKYLVLVCRSKLTCFLCGDIEIDLNFNSGVEINLIFLWGIKFDLVLVLGGGRNWFGFWMRANRLVLVWASMLTWFMSGWSILTWFQCGGPNSTYIQFRDRQFRDRKWFGLCLGVENDLVQVSGSKLTWILYDVRPQIDIWSLDR